jgi:hypothetical protein
MFRGQADRDCGGGTYRLLRPTSRSDHAWNIAGMMGQIYCLIGSDGA